MTKVQFFLGDDTEPFTIKQPHQSREKRTANKNDIVKTKQQLRETKKIKIHLTDGIIILKTG